MTYVHDLKAYSWGDAAAVRVETRWRVHVSGTHLMVSDSWEVNNDRFWPAFGDLPKSLPCGVQRYMLALMK
jgi:hypothetical protein